MLPLNLADAVSNVTVDDITPILEAIKGQITVESVISVIAVVTGACVGFAFMWWGVNFLKAKIMKAIKKGKV